MGKPKIGNEVPSVSKQMVAAAVSSVAYTRFHAACQHGRGGPPCRCCREILQGRLRGSRRLVQEGERVRPRALRT
eukprot:764442-Hanusia_phi.AAC.6